MIGKRNKGKGTKRSNFKVANSIAIKEPAGTRSAVGRRDTLKVEIASEQAEEMALEERLTQMTKLLTSIQQKMESDDERLTKVENASRGARRAVVLAQVWEVQWT